MARTGDQIELRPLPGTIVEVELGDLEAGSGRPCWIVPELG